MTTRTSVHPARHRAQLTATDVTVVRGARTVLDRVDLAVSPGARIAIVGENGRGKSTLLQVLAGTLVPDAGSVHLVGTIGVADQEMPADDDRTVGDAVAETIAPAVAALDALTSAATALADGGAHAEADYAAALEHAEALDAWDAERRVVVALEALGATTDMARPLASMSVGQRYRVRLACLLGADDDILLLDEPTNHLDRAGLDALTEHLRDRRGAVVLVSHDRALLSDVAGTFVDLDPTADGRPIVTADGYDGYRAERTAARERWEQLHERQVAERERLRTSLDAAQGRLVSGWRPEKGTNKHGRATRAGGLVQQVHRRQEALDAAEVGVPEPPQRLRFPQLPSRPGAPLLTLDGVHADGRLHEPVSAVVSGGDRLVVTGPNGAGKSTLLRIASGDLAPDGGTVRRHRRTRLGVLRQESALPPHRRAADALRAHVDALVVAGTLPEAQAIGLAELGLLRPAESSTRIGDLSMGQQRRLDLAIVLATRPHVLLLDEPTNHLSIALVDDLTEAFDATDAAVVLATHDRRLLADVDAWPRIHLAARS